MPLRHAGAWMRAFSRPPRFLPVSGRQNLARRADFDADDMAPGIESADERSISLRPRGRAASDGDIHGVGFGIVSCVSHGFRLALRSNITLITRMPEQIDTTRAPLASSDVVILILPSRLHLRSMHATAIFLRHRGRREDFSDSAARGESAS